jgi:predicted kinase
VGEPNVLLVVSGLPGVGKSALADAVGRRLRAPVLSVDPIEAAILRSGIPRSFETGLAAYQVVAALAEQQLALGLDVVVDAVSSLEVAREMWRAAARPSGAAMHVVEVRCDDVDLHRTRLAGRRRDLVGFPEPTWDEVESRREEWEPWTEPRIVVDAAAPLAIGVEAVLAGLGRSDADEQRHGRHRPIPPGPDVATGA